MPNMQATKLAFEKTDDQGNVVAAVSYDALAGADGEITIRMGANSVTLGAAQIDILRTALGRIKQERDDLGGGTPL